ncbi:MAG: hypothetical protein FWC23_02960 [Chitinispirillia bacterium]|nr:hypothetical protein [Chitinispirillia bacterium]MCL2268136.1 hypothetical protein [Chitinispirillia bacterium]
MATLEDVEKTLDRITRSMEESDKAWRESRAENERVLAESRAERERVRAETERVLAASRADTERARAETERALAEKLAASRAETERILAESRADTERAIKAWVSRVGNDIGYIVEVVLLPGIRQKMNDFGHNFNRLCPRYQCYRKDGRRLLEVDVLLENGTETMAVEVKTRLTKDGVQDHVTRLKTMRDNEAATNLIGKKLYSAVAGLNIDSDASNMALDLGMYVIEMHEDKKLIHVIKPDVELRIW